MRRIGIATKLYGNALIVLIMILSMGILIFRNLLNIEALCKEMAERDKYANLCLEREVDHFKWATALGNIFMEKQLKANIQTDYKFCELGKFIYGEDAKRISNDDQDAAEIIISMVEPHKNLHHSAILIFDELAKITKNTTEKEADLIRERAYNIFREDTSFALTQVQSKLQSLAEHMKEKSSEAQSQLYKSIRISIASLIIITFAALIVSLVLNIVTARSITIPISQITKIAKLIAAGNIYSAKSAIEKFSASFFRYRDTVTTNKQTDEISSLINSVNSMTNDLNSLVSQAQKSIIQTASSVSQIAASSKEQEATVTEVSVSITEIAASSEQIAATSQSIANSMDKVADGFNHTAEFAEQGHSILKDMHLGMEQIAVSTESISSKLSNINEKGRFINEVVVTITHVADRTNLLSLNASIEAEMAGEYGKGFHIVAREIRRLADQTAVATLDIAKNVKDMQSAVASGVMEMDRFSAEVQKRVKETVAIISSLDAIMNEIQSLHAIFNSIVDESKQQADGAKQISVAIRQLNDAVKYAAESLREFNSATMQLNVTTQELRKEISIFNVGNELDSHLSRNHVLSSDNLKKLR